MRMPCQVYSGIAPPPALLEAMANRTQAAATSSDVPPATPTRPLAPTNTFHGRPTQTTDHIEPSPEDIPPDAPPSYEDAMADRVGPIQGPRGEYQQPEPAATAPGEKPPPRLFDENPP